MAQLSEVVHGYIQTTFPPEVNKTIIESFTLLENFTQGFYEDKYFELINRVDTIDNNSKQDLFICELEADISNIIREHHIFLNEDIRIPLYDLNEIANFLYIIQNLEDYEFISYRIHSEESTKTTLIDLMVYYTLLEKHRLMEIISHIEDSLLTSLKLFVADKIKNIDVEISRPHTQQLKYFFEFIKNTPCLGLKYFEQGYTNIDLESLFMLTTTNIVHYIEKTVHINLSQVALDCLSILYLCKDSFELPLLKFKQNRHLFTEDLNTMTKLETVMIRMINDFNDFSSAKCQERDLNVKQI